MADFVAAVIAQRTRLIGMTLQTSNRWQEDIVHSSRQEGWLYQSVSRTGSHAHSTVESHQGEAWDYDKEGLTCCRFALLPMYSSSSTGMTLRIPNVPFAAKACKAPIMNPGPCG